MKNILTKLKNIISKKTKVILYIISIVTFLMVGQATAIILLINNELKSMIPLAVFVSCLIACIISYFILTITKKTMEFVKISTKNQVNNIEELSFAMNDISKAINDVTSDISEISDNINDTNEFIEEIREVSSEISSSSDEVSSEISDVTRLVEEINAMIENVSNNSHNVNNEASNAVDIAKDGKNIVKSAISEMDTINQSMNHLMIVIKGLGGTTSEIGKIVEGIDNIAHQTNLLALNASIEAARAGEHGKGFAVVAEEINRLAHQSGEFTKDITVLIEQIKEVINNAINTTEIGVQKVSNGVSLVNNTGKAFENIFDAIEKTSVLTDEIAASTDEQMNASTSIFESIQKAAELSSFVSAANTEQLQNMNDAVNTLDTVNMLCQRVTSLAQEQSASSEEILATVENTNEIGSTILLQLNKIY